MKTLSQIIEHQKDFQRAVGFPIDSIAESDRNEMSEKYIFKCIEELVELRKEVPSVINPWSKKQKPADLQRIKEEFSDVILFLVNLSIVWKFTPEEILTMVEDVQDLNFIGLKRKKMDLLNSDILKIPGRISGVGQGNLSPKYVFIGQNPGEGITHGYQFWSTRGDGSSKILLPALDLLGITDDCYFTNLVKCTTPGNEEPSQESAKFYLDFLLKELDILQIGNPNMEIIAMGNWTFSHTKVVSNRLLKHPAWALRNGVTVGEYAEFIKDSIQ